ncbi:MAG: ORF6N domain-containing protein [Lachnospiraceae bacterium]|nr:ORF6N domain-containing protein [Lachnospiraceae bacterium]
MSENRPNELVPSEITVESLKAKIYMIRGQKVMLASDLAEIYGYTTKAFNQQVKNNIEKFEDDFRFQLTWDEVEELSRSKNLTLNRESRGSNVKYLPWCFTESGVYMLMTVLKGNLAIRQSKALIRAFKQMKDYLSQDPLLSGQPYIEKLSLQIDENTRHISEIKEKMITREDLTKVIQSFSLPDKGIEYVIYAGQTFEADAAYADIYSKAKKKLYIVDNYIGPKTLLMLKSVPANVDIIIFSDNVRNIFRLSEFHAFETEYPSIRLDFRHTGGKFHDRYIIIDYKCRSEKIFHCGASSKDAGNKITTIMQADNTRLYYPMIEELLLQPALKLN